MRPAESSAEAAGTARPTGYAISEPDHSTRLQFFGGLAVLCGAGSILLGLLHFLLPRLEAAGNSLSTGSLWMSALTYLAIGGVLIWAGIGSLRLRRWTRAVMLVIGWSWIACGALGTVLVAFMLDDLIELALLDVDAPPRAALLAVRASILGLAALAGIGLPGAFILAYRDPAIVRTCVAADPRPDWTERCPLTVLGLSLGLAAVALFSIPLAVQPVVPAFGRLITGWPGTLLLLLGGAFSALLARGTYLLAMSAWWGTVLLLVLVCIAVALTFARVEPTEYFRAFGYPDAQIDVLSRSVLASREFSVGGTIALTLASLAYLVSIRRYFRDRESGARP